MSLLGNIAAALSAGVGDGMVGAGKWGIEEEAQRKKEAADDARLKEQLKRYDDDRQSRDKYYAGQLEEMKNERTDRAEQARLERENNLKIAGMRGNGGGGSSKSDALSALKMLDATITGIDGERARLIGKLDGADAATTIEIQATIANLSSQRENLLNSGDANVIWSANGQIGAAHRSQFFAPDEEAQKDQGNIPASLVVPPPRRPDANQSNWSGGDPSLQPQSKKTPAVQNNYGIWDRVSSDVSSLGSGLLNKMNNAYNKPLNR